MTPTPTVLLLVALLWTLPATTAALVYRKHGNSVENVKTSLSCIVEGLLEPQTHSDA